MEKAKICIGCGKEFMAKRAAHRFCSYECRLDFYRIRRREKADMSTPIKCARCGKTFVPSVPYQVYCSKECRVKYFREQDKLKRARNQEAIDTAVQLETVKHERGERDFKKAPRISLAEKTLIAKAAGMSYGKYDAMCYMESAQFRDRIALWKAKMGVRDPREEDYGECEISAAEEEERCPAAEAQ